MGGGDLGGVVGRGGAHAPGGARVERDRRDGHGRRSPRSLPLPL